MKPKKQLAIFLACTLAVLGAVPGCSAKADGGPDLAALAMSAGQSKQLGGARIGVNAAELNMNDIARIELTVTGTNLPGPIKQELVRAGDNFQGVLLEIPVGTDRIFTAVAYDATDVVVFQGELKNVEIKANETVLVAMTLQSLTTAPVFGNAAPIISGVTVSAASVQPGEAVKIEAVASDLDGDALTFSWSAAEGSFNPANDAATFWTAPATLGYHKTTLSVSDIHGATVSLSLNMEVAAGAAGNADVRVGLNNAPVVLNILANPARLGPGESTQITATVSDPDGDSLSYAWSASCNGYFSDANVLNPVFNVDDGVSDGSCVLTLTVTDGKGGSNLGTLLIHVVKDASVTNHPPVLFDAFQQSLSVEAGKTLVFRVRGKDPEGKALTFVWSAPSGSLSSSTETPHGADNLQSEIVWTAPICGSDIRLQVRATDADNFATTYEYLSVTVIGAPVCSTPNSIIISKHSNGTLGNDHSEEMDISADGRYTAFKSTARNLVDNDNNNYLDVFVHDSQTGETTLVSRATDGTQGNGYSYDPQISADGRFVAFTSGANSLVAGDTNNWDDVFVHDRQTGETTRISEASDGTEGNGSSRHPSISGDGRFVAFTSEATNFIAGGLSNNVYLHDRQLKTTTFISYQNNGNIGENVAWAPSISADGRYVVYQFHRFYEAVYDRLTDSFEQPIIGLNGANPDHYVFSLSLNGDGNLIVFQSAATNLVEGDVNGKSDIFVFNRQTKTSQIVSLASDGTQANGTSKGASISDDGRYVTFLSEASNLGVNNVAAGEYNVYLHDLQTGETRCLSLGLDGKPINAGRLYATISPSGSHAAFFSASPNLAVGDDNQKSDVFLYSLK